MESKSGAGGMEMATSPHAGFLRLLLGVVS